MMERCNTLGAEVPQRESQVISQMGQLSRLLDSLNESFSRLAQKIDPVMVPPAPSAPMKPQAEECLVPLADQIRRINNRVVEMRIAVDSVTHRIEL